MGEVKAWEGEMAAFYTSVAEKTKQEMVVSTYYLVLHKPKILVSDRNFR